MKTYVACVGGEAVLAFRAENDDEAHAMIDDKEGIIRTDLKVLVGTDGNPVPLHPGHSISVTASTGSGFFIKSFS